MILNTCAFAYWQLDIFFQKCLFRFFAHFYIGLSLLLSFKCSLSTLNTSASLDIWFANIFSHSVVCLFNFLLVSFEAKFYILTKINLSIFFFYCLCFWCQIRNQCHMQGHEDVPLCFLLRVFLLYLHHLSIGVNYYVFFLAVLGLSCTTQDLHWSMRDLSLRHVGFSLFVACGLSRWGARAQ